MQSIKYICPFASLSSLFLLDAVFMWFINFWIVLGSAWLGEREDQNEGVA